MVRLLLVVQVPGYRDMWRVTVALCPPTRVSLGRGYVQNMIGVVFDNKVGLWTPFRLPFGPRLYVNDCLTARR
jgi:hypothetical protein